MSENNNPENKREISDLTVIALVTSVLIAPVGWFLGFRARKEIEANNGYGRPFATAAIWIGGIITVGLVAMMALGALSMGFGEGRFGNGYGHHMMFEGNGGDRDGFGPGRGMMGWQDDSSTTSNG